MDQRQDSSGSPRPVRILLKPRVRSQDQKRASERTSTMRSIPVRMDGSEQRTNVPLVNISPTGLQISVGEHVETGTRIIIEVLPQQERTATIRWSREDDGDYLLGAEWDTPLTFDDVWKIRSGDENS